MKTSGPNSSPSKTPKSKRAPASSRAGRLAGRIWGNRLGRVLVVLLAVGGLISVSMFAYFYAKYSRLIDEKLAAGPYGNASRLFGAPRPIVIGEEASIGEIANYLRRSGYSESRNNRMGWYFVRNDGIDIYPGPDGFESEPAVLKVENGRLSEIISLRDNAPRTQYRLEPELITNLFDRKREKRRLVKFADIPKVMVDAALAAEDKRFFAHAGFDPIGILRAVYVDLKSRGNNQGASTLSMQLARSIWLTNERSWRRKIPEALITLHLEQKLSKEQIFEHYANTIYLGHHGTFSIHGFAEAANVYLGKDLNRVTLPEAALIAGLIQSPISRNPFRHPDRARSRRNQVLKMMNEAGFLNTSEMTTAMAAPLTVSTESAEGNNEAPYYVDMANEFLQQTFQDRDFQAHSYRVYTTLDLDLQRDAVAAMKAGMEEVDKQLARKFKGYGTAVPPVQAALVALDAQTGEVKALVGGRDYGKSQLNRTLAKRQPGSAFKPFVYAAALSSGVGGSHEAITPITRITDQPTTFFYDGKPYEPENFGDQYNGPVTVRQALAKSLNVPTVKLAERVGYRRVAQLARDAGMNMEVRGTPAVALGAYVTTPLEVAGAYTVFSTYGTSLKPAHIASIRDESGNIIYTNQPQKKRVLDPRVAYLVTNLMEEVMRSGTGAGARARGFWQPAAGKTGSSRDGWFAGFTSRLICVVWVGFDDNADIKLEGAKSALPVWTEFMKRAHQRRAYRNVSGFQPPDGIVTADIDPASGLLASASCPGAKTEVFIAGTQPLELCGGSGRTQIAGWDPVKDPEPAPAGGISNPQNPAPRQERKVAVIPVDPVSPQKPADKSRQKGFFGRLRDMLK
jgi:penicillin-binding protein 1B